MSTFHYIGLKLTIVLLIMFLPCIIIGGMISLCSFIKDKVSEIKSGICYTKRIKNKK